MARTTNLDLYVTDDNQENFVDFRTQLCGENNSNMTKIDEAFLSIRVKTATSLEGTDDNGIWVVIPQ